MFGRLFPVYKFVFLDVNEKNKDFVAVKGSSIVFYFYVKAALLLMAIK